jgi:hypothetical protein
LSDWLHLFNRYNTDTYSATYSAIYMSYWLHMFDRSGFNTSNDNHMPSWLYVYINAGYFSKWKLPSWMDLFYESIASDDTGDKLSYWIHMFNDSDNNLSGWLHLFFGTRYTTEW